MKTYLFCLLALCAPVFAQDSVRTVVREAVVVCSTRAELGDPITQTNIDTTALRRVMMGQDVQYVLESTAPSVIAFSESGTSFSNYGSFRMRGIDQTRINVTLNGAPLNDMIDQGVFFSNITDLLNGMESVQVQRGVGSTQNGTASYAGAVSMQSPSLSERNASGQLQLTAGSYGLRRGSAQVYTGLTPENFSAYAKVSTFTTDGYRYNTATSSISGLVSLGWFGADDLLKLTITGGNTKNELGYYAVPKPLAYTDPRTNVNDSTDNDDFGQYLAQLEWSHSFSESLTLSTQLYGTTAGGDYFSGFRDSVGTLTQINYPLTNTSFGGMAFVELDDRFTFGIHGYRFLRHNWETVSPESKTPYYEDSTSKVEFSGFVKADLPLGDLALYGDVQVRHVTMSFMPDMRYIPAGTSIPDHSWLFINPRIGARYTVAPSFSTYVSAGYTGREPTRFDLLGGTQINEANLDVLLNTNTVRPEYALDFEAGVKFTSSVFSADVTAFSMHFTDEIAPIGQYIEQQFVQLRKNVPTSRRQGVELGLTVDLLGINKAVFEGVSVGDFVGGEAGTLMLNVTGTWMHAVIDEYAPENLGIDTVYTNVRPVLTPDFMMSISLRWTPLRALEFEGTMRLVGEQFLELTNQPYLVLDPYAVLDVRASYVFSKFLAVKLAFYNVTSTLYAANGATGWYGDQVVPTLFMQAPFNMVGTVELTL